MNSKCKIVSVLAFISVLYSPQAQTLNQASTVEEIQQQRDEAVKKLRNDPAALTESRNNPPQSLGQQLAPEKLLKIKAKIKELDRNGNGRLDPEEIPLPTTTPTNVLASFSSSKQKELEKYDLNKDGVITSEERITATRRETVENATRQMRQICGDDMVLRYDKNKNGVLEKDEYVLLLDDLKKISTKETSSTTDSFPQ